MSQDVCNLNIKQGGEKEGHLGESRWQGALSDGCEGYHLPNAPECLEFHGPRTQALPLCSPGSRGIMVEGSCQDACTQSASSFISDLGGSCILCA